MTRSSESWDELQTRWARGDALTPAEEQRRLREAAEEPLRARELAFFTELAARPAAPTTPAHELVDSVLSESSARAHLRVVTPPPVPRSPRTRVRRFAFAAAAALSAAVALVAVTRALPADDVSEAPRPVTAPPAPLAHATLRWLDGDVFRGEARALPGALAVSDVIATEEGRACVEIESSIEVCAGAHSRVSFEALATQHVKVRVERGVAIARLAKRAPGRLFSLVSGDVTATARGTTFSLSRDAIGVVHVAVLEGAVAVQRAGGPETLVEADHSASLEPVGDARPGALDSNEREVLERLFDREKTTASSPPPPVSAAKREPSPPSAAELLENARRELERGNARAAHASYERLRASYPASPEARTVLVTMGKLELDLGRPERALASFDAYLAAGGALALEAQSGKIRALRALGRAGGEKRAIEEYLARFPNGFEAPALTRRLAALSAP